MRYNIAGTLVGIGLAFGVVPIFIASVLVKENLFVLILDQLDGYYKSKLGIPAD